jgi:hypothetical protein
MTQRCSTADGAFLSADRFLCSIAAVFTFFRDIFLKLIKKVAKRALSNKSFDAYVF